MDIYYNKLNELILLKFSIEDIKRYIKTIYNNELNFIDKLIFYIYKNNKNIYLIKCIFLIYKFVQSLLLKKSAKHGFINIIKFIVYNYKINNDDINIGILSSAKYNHYNTFIFLHKNGGNININNIFYHICKNNNLKLLNYCNDNNHQIFKYLKFVNDNNLDLLNDDYNEPSKEYLIVLYNNIFNDNKNIVNIIDTIINNLYFQSNLIKNIKLDFQYYDLDNFEDDITHFILVCQYGYLDIVKYFYDNNIHTKLLTTTNFNFNCGVITILNEHYHVLDFLLVNNIIDIDNHSNTYSFTLFFTACLINNLEIVKYLYYKNANINILAFQDYDEDDIIVDIEFGQPITAFSFCCATGYLDIVKFLIDKVDINDISNYEKTTPLLFALLNEQYKTVEFLIKNGANIYLINENNETATDFEFNYNGFTSIKNCKNYYNRKNFLYVIYNLQKNNSKKRKRECNMLKLFKDIYLIREVFKFL
jgi:ankyrin repeat protein